MCDAIYIHIPFCIQKCRYCDFLSFSCEDITEVEIEKYIKNLVNEIRMYPKQNYTSIYFGGGTPSFLNSIQIEAILKELNYNLETEITLEVNPHSTDIEKLREFKKIGINRLSIGIQSFNNERLKVLGRNHNRERAIEIYKEAREVGFENISIDVIFATPNQTVGELLLDLDMIEKLKPEHISIYSLIWEEGTKFMELLKKGELTEIDNEVEGEMYEKIIFKLTSLGYKHYEISNFSKEGYESRHNSKYWKNLEYIGVGLGASGYYNNIRYKNNINFDRYYGNISNGIKPILEKEIVTSKDKLENYYILGLRLLIKGIEVSNEKYLKKMEILRKDGYIKLEEGRFKLTSKGLMFANDVFVEIIED